MTFLSKISRTKLSSVLQKLTVAALFIEYDMLVIYELEIRV